jgi:hypothetical protein
MPGALKRGGWKGTEQGTARERDGKNEEKQKKMRFDEKKGK